MVKRAKRKKRINFIKLINEKLKLNSSHKGKNKLQNLVNIKETLEINIIYNGISLGYIKLLLILILFIQVLSNSPSGQSVFSNIKLKIYGKGVHQIFCSDVRNFSKDFYPNEIYINNNKITNVTPFYFLDQENENIISLVWNKSINNAKHMFHGCSNITEIDLSHFDTSKITQTSDMFTGCSKLISINFSNFDTSKVTHIGYMFKDCSSLISLNLSSFDTSNAKYMRFMFYGCSSLSSLDLSNFNTSKVIRMNNMFYGCSNLTSLNLSNFNTAQVTNMNSMFDGCTKLEYINLKNFKDSKFVINLENIFNQVPDNIVICINKNNTKILEQIEQKKCYNIDCSIDWKSKQKKIIITNNTNCYENCRYNYYFDKNNNFTCTINDSCPKEYPILIEDKKECVIDNNPKYSELTVSDYYITKLKYADINNFIQNIYNYWGNRTEKRENMKEEELYNKIMENIENIFINRYDIANLDEDEEQIIKAGKLTITLTTTNNKNNNNTNNNMTIIDLGECENLLRKFYNISDNEILYMKKIDVKQEKIKIPKVEYNIYRKTPELNLEKLNLSICNESKISIIIPIKITENIDKLNSSSDYFNNICYQSKSDKGTDISLKDRQKEFVEGDKTVCQEKCNFSDYNSYLERANCSCEVIESTNSFSKMNINKDELYKNFGEINSKSEFSNLGITSCNVLVSKENIESNAGFFLLLIILALFIIIYIIL